MVNRFDFLVIGSGIAGMSFALKVAGHGKVALVGKTTLEDAKNKITPTAREKEEKSPIPAALANINMFNKARRTTANNP